MAVDKLEASAIPSGVLEDICKYFTIQDLEALRAVNHNQDFLAPNSFKRYFEQIFPWVRINSCTILPQDNAREAEQDAFWRGLIQEAFQGLRGAETADNLYYSALQKVINNNFTIDDVAHGFSGIFSPRIYTDNLFLPRVDGIALLFALKDAAFIVKLYKNISNAVSDPHAKFVWACILNQFDVVKRDIENFYGGNSHFRMLVTKMAAYFASRYGHLQIIKYLIEERGIDVNQLDYKGHHPLVVAIDHNQMEIVNYFTNTLNQKLPFDMIKKLLFEAIETKDMYLARLLMTVCEEQIQGHEAFMSDSPYMRVLLWAISNSNWEFIQYVIEKNNYRINMNQYFYSDVSPLTYAVSNVNLEIFKKLIQYQKQYHRDAIDYNHLEKLLSMAILEVFALVTSSEDRANYIKIVAHLIAEYQEMSHAILSQAVLLPFTAPLNFMLNGSYLYDAFEGKHLELARILIEGGANLHLLNCEGLSPLDIFKRQDDGTKAYRSFSNYLELYDKKSLTQINVFEFINAELTHYSKIQSNEYARYVRFHHFDVKNGYRELVDTIFLENENLRQFTNEDCVKEFFSLLKSKFLENEINLALDVVDSAHPLIKLFDYVKHACGIDFHDDATLVYEHKNPSDTPLLAP